MDSTHVYSGRDSRIQVPLSYNPKARRGLARSTRHSIRSFEEDTVTGTEAPERLLLWIDAVGGFLVCLDDHVTLGQPTPGGQIALPIMADISRRHAVIRRDGGAYVLEPVQETYLDGNKLTGSAVLTGGNVIQLGSGVRIKFSKPHALSSTARLDIESGHKTQPTADAILLMADSLLIGPSNHCHIRARDWTEDAILYRSKDEILCRTAGKLTVDNRPARIPASVTPGARIEGEEFSLCAEKV